MSYITKVEGTPGVEVESEYFPLSNFCLTKTVLILYGSVDSILLPQLSYLYVVFNPNEFVIIRGFPNKSIVTDSIFPSGDVVLTMNRLEESYSNLEVSVLIP
ncbi:hypothetical protein SAMN05421738_12312 [Algoriella xinjiangensis]|uniref:Uncharacterized protein n=1 Tax=Algoriella xinjiangensis TaxID=684065 RepID=A0A1I5B8Q0_9FLAO|nr:hypothetical protein [Algoriella xinjiangensis]SFN71010.1 hypothetical protein SAMN05421738_12312 [Algoriella xinjiangensis]